MSPNDSGYIKKDLPDNIFKAGSLLLVVGLVLGISGFLVDSYRASFAYLVSFIFFLSIVVGSLFLVALEYAANADWSTPFRRVSEFLAAGLPLLLIFAIPLMFNTGSLFQWSHADYIHSDKMLEAKSAYLNTPFFMIRVFAIIIIWILFYTFIIRNSRKQDESGNQLLTKRNIILSVIFIPVFAITVTLVAVDWIMSLESKWFSTIFGVYLFAGVALSALAALTLVSIKLKEKGFLHPAIKEDHYYSLGTLMFAFTAFWGYIAFSQYMLIWYGNLPEETFWFMQRWEGGWKIISILLIVTHFIVPFFYLLSYESKTNPKKLKFISIWILCVHFLDLYWLIMPSMSKNDHAYSLNWIDFVFPLVFIGVILMVFQKVSEKINLVPVGDPKLKRGLDFHL
ncbi:quinol:cytochrome C oxidoreductase [bacterium BMS3Abin03]|nr:quinol:cytochrome C oxidoreductase [bacterium BMS3Abin03]MCG6959261.1 quinol:cytochrome C oxidoreductase [bacterium BMS3Abin03]